MSVPFATLRRHEEVVLSLSAPSGAVVELTARGTHQPEERPDYRESGYSRGHPGTPEGFEILAVYHQGVNVYPMLEALLGDAEAFEALEPLILKAR